MTLATDITRLRRCRWNTTADLLRDTAKPAEVAAVLLRMPVYLHTPMDKAALAALRRIARR